MDDTIPQKRCKTCHLLKPITDFTPLVSGQFGVMAHCRVCFKASRNYAYEYRRDGATRNKRRRKKESLRYKYNLTIEQHEEMFLRQFGLCAICGEAGDSRGLVIDHNHSTGDVRELLCSHCNSLLGYARENIHVMEKAIKYLKKHLT